MLTSDHFIRIQSMALALTVVIAATPSVAGRSAANDADVQPITRPLPADYRLNRDGSVTLRVCFNWSCAEQPFVTFSAEEINGVKEYLRQCAGRSLHDRIQRLRVGIWRMQLIAQRHLPQLANDREINDFEKGVEGRLDCVDSSTNTNTYLKILHDLAQLPGWTVAAPEVRDRFDLYGVHWTAVVVDTNRGKRWSVDSWFRPHGHLPFVMPLADWKDDKRAWEPPYDRENPYPRSMEELCPRVRQTSDEAVSAKTMIPNIARGGR